MAGGKRLDAFLDIASLYSFVAFEDLVRNLTAITANGVHVELHPVLLGAINKASGNQPPWALKAKAKYIDYDRVRACRRVGLPPLALPDNFLARAITTSALRALHHIKANHPQPVFLASFRALFCAFWLRGGVDLTQDDNLRDTLLRATEGPDGKGGRLFPEADVESIMSGRAGMKDAVRGATARALEVGAFGAPWFWASNGRGEEQPFFGSDRFNHIYEFLEIPFSDVEAKPPSKAKL
ncbi:Glutathione S-transferase kappa 1 [Escovopsis weberi]|uniref:Glutathione S-transferase kappa 1 n=1 Tax=Escovopsis weberi TaxID=150374 RepID=A0A0M9VSQ4_ESCWE|nr:Glutathione S-transferase kappa 1 [Escovopsis weberi]